MGNLNNSIYLAKIALMLLIIFMISKKTSAQQNQPYFDRITSDEELSQSTVNTIIQDKSGFLWFATYNGLNRFDGYSFKIFRHVDGDSTSLSHNSLVYIFEDKDGFIWVVNNGNAGLDRLDPKTNQFINFEHDQNNNESISSNSIQHVMQDSKDNLWICAGNSINLFVEEEKNGKAVYKFKRYSNPFSNESVKLVFENSNGQLLVFTNELYFFDSNAGTFRKTNIQIESMGTVSVVEDNEGTLYIGTVDSGIFKLKYNKATSSYTKVDPGKLNVTPNNRNRLLIDKYNTIWIGTVTKGLYRYHPKSDQLDHFVSNTQDNSTISDNTIYSLYEDRAGILWIGTFSRGLCKYDFHRKEFTHFKSINGDENTINGNLISAINGLKPDDLWIGCDLDGAVNRLIFSDGQKPKVILYKHDANNPNTIADNSVLSLVQRKNGDVWLSSRGGAISIIKHKNPFEGPPPVIRNLTFTNWTFIIFEDSQGVLWGGTWGKGLWRFNDKTSEFDFFSHNPDDSTSICDNIVWAFNEDKDGNIWIGGHGNGISILPAKEKSKSSPKFLNFKHIPNNDFSISNNTIHSFCCSKDGTMWIGTDGGLNKTINKDFELISSNQPPNIKFTSYHQRDGMPNESVVGILEDNNGNLWLSTNNGISKFNPDTETFINYYKRHGLQNNEFWHNAYFKDANGRLYFGGNNGFNAFYPDRIKANPFLPEVAITELKLFNKIVNPGDTINNQVVLNKTINKTNELVLSYKNNNLTFEFAALHFSEPTSNLYAFYLENFDKDWNYVGTQRTATYTNLNPGEYVLRVKASNNDGIWSEEEVKLTIIITPPWWGTTLFRVLSVIFIVSFILAIFRYRLTMLKRQKKQLQKEVLKRTEELTEANSLLEKNQEEITLQNEELLRHRTNLEALVEERTSELEKAKLKAEESDRLKSSFLANMSHEIRTPMNAILGFSNLLRNENLDSSKKEQFIDTITSNSETLMVLIDDIIDISIIEADQVVLSPKYFDAIPILLELEDYYRLKNRDRIKFEFENKNDKEVIIHADPVRFKQIINNLLDNAQKYTHQGFVKFGYKRLENEILFYVSDSGIGIDPEHAKNIFNHFYKIELKSARLYRGTGIGLTITKKLVELLGGKIWVESEKEVGSTFKFRIPHQS